MTKRIIKIRKSKKDLCCLSFGHCVVCLLAIVLSVVWSLCCLSFGHCVVCLSQWPKDRQHNGQKTDNTMTKRQTTQWPKDRQHNDQNVVWSLCCLSFGYCVVSLLVIVLSVFWSLCCLSFGHCVVCLLVIVPKDRQQNGQKTDNTMTKRETTQ
jgi:predicted nucleic acid-binding Zn ribbon protein